jgi:hypothetical protein
MQHVVPEAAMSGDARRVAAISPVQVVQTHAEHVKRSLFAERCQQVGADHPGSAHQLVDHDSRAR